MCRGSSRLCLLFLCCKCLSLYSKPEQTTARGTRICPSLLPFLFPWEATEFRRLQVGPKAPVMATSSLLAERTPQVCTLPSPLYSTGALCLESPTLLSCYYLWTPPPHPQRYLKKPLHQVQPAFLGPSKQESLDEFALWDEKALFLQHQYKQRIGPALPVQIQCVSHRGNVSKVWDVL